MKATRPRPGLYRRLLWPHGAQAARGSGRGARRGGLVPGGSAAAVRQRTDALQHLGCTVAQPEVDGNGCDHHAAEDHQVHAEREWRERMETRVENVTEYYRGHDSGADDRK